MDSRSVIREKHSSLSVRRNRVVSACLVFGIACAFLMSGVSSASADDSQKTYWQERYRSLLTRADKLRSTVETERELYADANRRNYRRGSKRHRHHEAMEEAAAELVTVESELARIQEDGRRAGALPGWFYEVDLERKDAARRPAVAKGSGDGGRNPLYHDESEGKD